eukprot:jgi/Botrbrau1/18752/Bobra.0386s0075.1
MPSIESVSTFEKRQSLSSHAECTRTMDNLKESLGDMVSRLGKAILQLHSDDDQESDDVQQLATDYKVEMQFMLRSVADSINSFNENLWVKQDDSRLQQAVEELSIRHEKDRLKYQQDFEEYKSCCKDAAQQAEQESSKQLENLLSEVKSQMHAVQSLKEELAELKAQESAQKAGLQQQVDILKQEAAVARAETEEAVQSGNSQYMVLVAQQMQREEDIRSQQTDWQAQLEAAHAAASARVEELAGAREGWQKERDSLLFAHEKEKEKWSEALAGLEFMQRQQLAHLQECQTAEAELRLQLRNRDLNVRALEQAVQKGLERDANGAEALSQLSTSFENLKSEHVQLQQKCDQAESGVLDGTELTKSLRCQLVEAQAALQVGMRGLTSCIYMVTATCLQRYIEPVQR